VLADVSGDRDALRDMVHPALRDLVDELEPCDDASIAYGLPSTHFGSRIGFATHFGSRIGFATLYQRVRDASGRVVGGVCIAKPAVGMATIGMLTGAGDLGHFERIQHVTTAGKRPAAVLFADLEGSTQLAKRLPTATYFTLVRRLTRAADKCVVDAGGLVGRHAGDGVTAFFVAETAGSESAAVRACISAVRALQIATRAIAARHDLAQDEITVRAGLHWGATLYIGSIITSGRSEVTALGDEVNEAARIEACASGGRALASKALLERLNDDDAAALDLDPNKVSYIQLADLDTATEKARRDAPAIAVCDIAIAIT
jgi:class 3 adenylate cyclase